MNIANVEVNKNQNESSSNLLRRFSRRVQETSILKKAKIKRFNKRPKSKLSAKKSALLKIERIKKYEKLKKLGKII